VPLLFEVRCLYISFCKNRFSAYPHNHADRPQNKTQPPKWLLKKEKEKMKKVLRKTALLLLLLSPAISQAAPQWCRGTVDNLWTKNNGDVFVLPSSRGNHVQICNVKSTWKEIDPTTCMMWVSHAQAAVTTGKQTIIHYGDIASCSTMPVYSESPAPIYLMLNR